VPGMGHRSRSAAAHKRRITAACALAIAVHPMLGGAGAESRDAHAPAAPRHAAQAAHVAEAARRFAVPEDWIWRVMHAESGGNPRAQSSAGAMGLMQIMPATWAMLSARHGLGPDPFDTRANILAGTAYLRAMWDRYRNISLMLIAYNAGPGRADAYAAGRRGLPAETRAYVARLAPLLRGATDKSAPASRKEPPSWRDGSLFAARSGLPPQAADGEEGPVTLVSLPSLFIQLSRREP